MFNRPRLPRAFSRSAVFLAFAALASSLTIAAAEMRRFDIAAGEAPRTLEEFSRQSELQISFSTDAVRGHRTNAVAGEYEAKDALETMLGGTGLTFEFVNARMVAVMLARQGARVIKTSTEMAPAELRLASADSSVRVRGEDAEFADDSESAGASPESKATQGDMAAAGSRGIPEVLIRGTRILNTDIRRTSDDVQPYVVFERDVIAKSEARNIDEFLRTRLTSASSQQSPAQTEGGNNSSSIDLRGLGSQQTLILVDGRRVAPQNGRGAVAQSDLNGIPLAAVERIEVLPSTASGIYGGGATGGVVNIVLRRDYAGVEATATYESSFEGGGTNRRIDVAAGFAVEDGRTSVMLSGSYSDATDLLVSDRDFFARGRARILANNPASLLASTTPPLGATTNIRSSTGAPLTLRPQFGGASLGSAITFVPEGYAGPASDNGAALVANAGRYNLSPALTTQIGAGAYQSLVNTPEVESLTMTVRREFTPWLDVFLDLSGSKNAASFASNFLSGIFTLPSSAPGNPFNQAITVTTPVFGADQFGTVENRNEKAVGGAILELPLNWRAGFDYTWNRARSTSTFADAQLGTAASTAVSTGVTSSGSAFNVFRDTNTFPVDFSSFLTTASSSPAIRSTFRSTALRLAGPVGWSLPAGMPTVSLLLEQRKESLGEFSFISRTFTQTAYSRWQSVDSAYAEILVPLVSPQNEIPIIYLFELQIAGRRDVYDITGANTVVATAATPTPPPPVRVERRWASNDPLVSLRYQPLPDLTIRGSYATGFLPPAIHQLVPGAPVQRSGAALQLRDPLRGNELLGTITQTSGGNAELRAEESTSRSIGIILAPRFVPGLRASVDWTQIEKRDNTTFFNLSQQNINNEAFVPGLITRGPPSGGFLVGPIVGFNSQFLNVARQDVEAMDISLDYRLESNSWGDFKFSGAATRNFHNFTQVTAALSRIERVRTSAVLPWQANASVEWRRREWTVLWSARYFDSYCLLTNCATGPLTVSQGSIDVPSQTYHDLSITYQFPDSTSLALLANTTVRLGFRNILNEKPPVDVSRIALYSTYGDPNLATYRLSVTKHFF